MVHEHVRGEVNLPSQQQPVGLSIYCSIFPAIYLSIYQSICKHVHTTQSWYRDVTSRGRSDAIGPHLLALLATSCMELQVDLSNAGSRSSAPQLGTAGRSHLVILWDILQAMNRTMSGFIMG